MKMNKIYLKLLPLMAFGFLACEPEFDESVEENDMYTAGEADFSTFIAVGNSLTAGYADNALYRQGQMNSLPNIMAEQFEHVGGGEFTQPLMADNLGGLKLNGEIISGNRLVLSTVTGSPAPAPIAGESQTEVTNKLSGSFNNMGVPGAKSFHLLASGYGNVAGVLTGQANPYFARFSSSENATIIEDALAQNPSFFSLWIGNNDILGFATSGGAGVDQTGNLDPTTYGGNDITDPNVFAQTFSDLVSSLSANASGGVVYNIPNITNIPFFNVVAPNVVPLDEATAAQLNGGFQAYNQQVLPGLVQAGVISAEEAQMRQINFQAGNNYVTLVDEDLTDLSQILQGPPFNLPAQQAQLLGQVRQATDNDLIPLTASSVIGTTVGGDPTQINGVSIPLSDQYVLTSSEIEMVQNARISFNATIQSVAEANDLVLVDADALLSEVSQGVPFEGGIITSEFVTGGGFSLDGVHLTPRGYALVANETIRLINQKYGSNVPQVILGNYGTVNFSDDVMN